MENKRDKIELIEKNVPPLPANRQDRSKDNNKEKTPDKNKK
jgi:hypothetical protein